MSTPAHRQVFDPASADEPVTFADLKRFAESNVRATGTLLRETFGKFEDRLERLETEGKDSRAIRDASGRIERLTSGSTTAQTLRDDQQRLEKLVEQLQARVVAAEQRMVAAETKAAQLRWTGVWNSTAQYRANNLCTCSGATWIAQRDNANARPGKSPSDWIMIAKGHQKS